MDSPSPNPPNYNLNEQMYESSDKSIKIFKTRKRYTIQYIAVKVYSKKSHGENASLEYNILKNINHPSLVRCLGFTEDYNHFYMELEYCITGDLSKCLWQNKNSHYSEKIVKHVSTQILSGLQVLHKCGILHCNLKPSNILVDEYGNIRLCDFKKALRVNSMNQTEVRKNKSAMTPCYTAPELFSEDGVYNFKTDLWALGCIMYELAVGQVPFFDESVGRLMTKIINEEVNFNRKELQNFSDDFVDVLRRLLDKDPQTRISWGELERHSFWELNVTLFDNKENSLKSDVEAYVDPYSQQSSRSQSAKNRIGKTNSFGSIGAFDVGSNCQTLPNPGQSPHIKKNADILRLSRNALQNMMEEREDEYAFKDKPTEVDNADQEFKFDGKDGNKNEDYDSAERNDYGEKYSQNANDNMPNFEKFIKLKNPLEVSVLNVSHVIKRDKRKTNPNDELDKSIFKESEIPSIENLMFHQSDKIIKPIIGNKIIEIIPLTTFNKTKLPFQPWKIDKIKEICRSSNIKLMENYLLVIYSLMDQYYNKGDEENLLNLLNYFETIIQDKEIANNIINTSFITIFITFLAKNKSEALKTRVCCIIAYLIRYATVIENPLDELGLCRVLDTLVKDKNVELGRKAIATLGEYLFFVTTQAEGEEESSAFWKISDESLSTLLYATEINRDDTIKFYAVKAIENITALTQIAKLYFTPNDSFLSRFLEIFRYNKNPELRQSAVYTISHLIRLEPKLYKSFLDKLPLPELQKYLQNETTKIQQALLNCVLFAVHSESNKQALVRNENFSTFLAFLIQHLDHSNIIIKMKIVLTFSFILEDSYNIGTFGDKLFSVIQKLRKENSNELHQSVKVFESIFTNKMKLHVKNFIALMMKSMKLNTKMSNTNYFEEIVELSNALVTVASYPKIMHELYSLEFLDCLLKIIESTSSISSDNIDEYILKNVYEILRNFSENLSSVNENNEFIIKRMFVPILKSSLSIKFENKILPLNIAANMITLILDDDRLYSSTVLEEGKTKYINTLIIQVLPILKEMLKIEDLVFATLSFLSLIIERNSAFIKFYKTEGIMDYVFELMKDQNFYSNLNIIKIFIKLIEYSDTSFQDIINMNLIEKVNFLISNDTGDNSIFTEYVIELFYDLMFKINEQKKQIAVNIDKDEFKKFTNKIESVAKNFKMCIKLLGCDNINIQEKSCVSLIFLLQLFPDTYVESIGVYVKFTITDIPDLLKGLDSNCVKIHKRMIRIFRWIIEFQSKIFYNTKILDDASSVLKPYLSYINTYIENICNTSKDPEVVSLANKLINVDLKSINI